MKAWEMPVTAQQGIQTRLPAEVADWPFATVKDYDDYIARLHSIPMELRQASENLLAGINDNRAPAAATVTRAAAETEAIASQKAEASPFAAPLARFPAGIDAANRRRITADLLAAISSDVLPAYTRFAKFLRVAVLPAAGASDPALPPPGYGARERQILALRESAQAALGPRFDLDGFHRIVADSGALPVAAIEHQVNQWVGLRMAAK
jgi:uncharacterized protein (DUF885 family)